MEPRVRRRILTAVVVMVAVGGGAALSVGVDRSTRAAGETKKPVVEGPASDLEPHPEGVYWGWYRMGAPLDPTLLRDVEAKTGRRPSIVHWFHEWHNEPLFDRRAAQMLRAAGIVPMITWEPWVPPNDQAKRDIDARLKQSRYRLAAIARGDFDAHIGRYAAGIRLYGGPVILRPMHEMDGNWYPWGLTVNKNEPSHYIAAWRRIHDIFERVGATNVTWVWSVNHLSVPATPANDPAKAYPGDEYVDWIGISGFNFGGLDRNHPESTFDQIYEKRYAELLAYDKPMILTEIAVGVIAKDPPGWIADAFALAGTEKYDRIRAIVWYDQKDNREQDYRIDASAAMLRAFKRAISRPGVLSAPAAEEATVPGWTYRSP